MTMTADRTVQPAHAAVPQPRRPASGDALDPPAKQRRAVARALGLSDLLSRRPDLHGVYSPADVATEAVRWSA